MSQHLTSHQISMWMAGEHSPEADQHMQECADCAAELAAFAQELSQFGASLREWSERQAPPPVLRPTRAWPMRLALTMATLLLVASAPIYRFTHRDARPRMTPADRALLEQVDLEVSQAVPRPMEPLLELASAIGDPTDAAGKDNHAVTQRK